MTGITGAPPTADPIALIAEHLGAIRAVLEAGHEASERSRADARAALEAQRVAREVEAARRLTAGPAPRPDLYPFASMPAGTTVRDLPSGGKLFVLADGTFVRVAGDGALAVIGDSGEVVPLPAPRAGKIRLPDGRELTLKLEALRLTHEAAGISGLPASADPMFVAEDRYSVSLPDGTRLEVSQGDRQAVVVTRIGTIVAVGARFEAIGEELETQSLLGGLQSFASRESQVRGAVEPSGTIRLALPGGEDLVIRFPEASLPSLPTPSSELPVFCGEPQP